MRRETPPETVKRPRGRPPKDRSKEPLRTVGRPKKHKLGKDLKLATLPIGGRPKREDVTREQEDVFLDAMLNAAPERGGLGNTSALKIACKAIGIRYVSICMHRAQTPDFAARWDAVIQGRREIRAAAVHDKADEENILFLEALAETGRVDSACEAVGLPPQTMRKRKMSDPVFEEAWNTALELGTDRLEDEAVRRGRDGWDEPVFYKGELQGLVRKFSDNLLLAALRARRNEKWGDTSNLKLSGMVTLETVVTEAQKLRKRGPATIDQDGKPADGKEAA